MKSPRSSLRAFRAKLSTMKKNFTKLFHRKQSTLDTEPQRMIELAPTTSPALSSPPRAIELPPATTTGIETALPAAVFSATYGTSPTITSASTPVIPTPKYSKEIETQATSIVSCNASKSQEENFMRSPSAVSPIERVVHVLADDAVVSKPTRKRIASEALSQPEPIDDELKSLFELYQAAIEVFFPLDCIEVPKAELEQLEFCLDGVKDNYDNLKASLMLKFVLSDCPCTVIVLNSGLEQAIDVRLYRSESCASFESSNYSYASSSIALGKVERQFNRAYNHPKQMRRRAREKGMMAL